jgi:hypothetical protein
MKLTKLARLKPLLKLATPIALAAQTTVDVSQAVETVNAITPVLFTLLTIVIIIALPLLIFKVLGKMVLETVRG